MKTFDKAVVSAPGAGTLALGFGPHVIRISAEETAGHLGAFECEVPPGEGPPLHVHDQEDEFFRVLSGRFAFWCGDACVELETDGILVIPRGSVYRFQNVGTKAGRLMCVMTPGGFEGFFAAVEAEKPASPAAIDTLAARYNLRFVPPLAASNG